MGQPAGTIIFTTVGRPHYGFDVFGLRLDSAEEHRLTDGRSVNFNAQFVDDGLTTVFVSERSGCPKIYLSRPGANKPEPLPAAPGSLFHDRPVIRDNRLYFISAHEKPDHHFRSWSALYAADLDEKSRISRLTPIGSVDYSPSISQSGDLVAVASYGSRPWDGEFHELHTNIVVFRESEPNNRVIVCENGGWPTWSGDSAIFFHRQADDGWWSIYRVDLPGDCFLPGTSPLAPVRVTPRGVHCFTPAGFHDGKRITVATRRRGKSHRHIEIFDLKSGQFQLLTEKLNPNIHHYNPFVSSEFVGYHRFRGESAAHSELIIPHLEPVTSPVDTLRMLRLNGSFPSFSPSGDLIAFNHDFEPEVNGGLKVVRSDGSRRWTLIKGRTAFYNSWSPTEKNVIFTSLGPIFESVRATVQIARITFDLSDLDDRTEEVRCDVKILTKEDSGNNAFPSCSPDGKWIVFRSGRTGHKNLYVTDAVDGEFDGGSIRQLTDGPWIDTMPSWSPRGDLIAFSSNRHDPSNTEVFGIYLVRPDGTGLRRVPVAGGPGADRERLNHVCFSADGKWLLFTANLGGVSAEPVSIPNQFQPYGELHVVRVDGTGLRRLTWNGYENGTPAWCSGSGEEVGKVGLEGGVGDRLRGRFDEPLWISCDIDV